MPENDRKHKATTWLQIQPKINSYGHITGVTVVNATQKRPTQPYADVVLVKLGVEIPESAFDPIIASMVVDPGEAVAVVRQERES